MLTVNVWDKTTAVEMVASLKVTKVCTGYSSFSHTASS